MHTLLYIRTFKYCISDRYFTHYFPHHYRDYNTRKRYIELITIITDFIGGNKFHGLYNDITFQSMLCWLTHSLKTFNFLFSSVFLFFFLFLYITMLYICYIYTCMYTYIHISARNTMCTELHHNHVS